MKITTTILFLIPSLCFGQWTQLGNSINGESDGDKSGNSTALSADGSILAIGAPNNIGNSTSNGGHVRVYKNSNGQWTQIGSDINGETTGDRAGDAVSLSANGNILAVGEPYYDDQGFVTGRVRVFGDIFGIWQPMGQPLVGQTLQAAAGSSVDLSQNGQILAVGAPSTELNGIPFMGNVRIFEYQFQSDTWVQKGADIFGDGIVEKFGTSVSLSADGNVIAIGASGDPTSSGQQGDTGYVMVYQFTGGQWSQLGNRIEGFSASDQFGYSTSLSADGTILAVGNYANLNNVHVYKLIGGVWTLIGNPLVGEAPADAFGFSLSLSDDGSILAVGARMNGNNGSSAGRSYIYKNQGGNWIILNNVIDGEVAADQSGFSVSLSSNGSIVAIGAPQNDMNGSNSGHVRVFENISTSSVEDHQNKLVTKVFPNPTTDYVQVSTKSEIIAFEIVSVDGKLVTHQEVTNEKELNIDLIGLNSGTYLLKIRSENASTIVRIVKK